MSTLDPRAPFVVDTHDLGRRPGSMRTMERTETLTEDLGTEVVAVRQGSTVDLQLRLEAVMDGVLVTGSATGLAQGECGRCLDEVELPMEVTFQELFGYTDVRRVEGETDDEDAYELNGDLLDVGPVVRDAVVLSLPFTPLCSAQCPGLCSECGIHLADDPEHQHDDVDPRWAALKAMAGQQNGLQEES